MRVSLGENLKTNLGMIGRNTTLGQDRHLLYKDLILLNEVSLNSKQMLHCPSLSVFLIKEIFEDDIQDRKGFFYMLKSWKRL